MADFCYECVVELGVEPGLNDLAGACSAGKAKYWVCEGCGWGWFDHEGRRVTR